MSGPESAEPSQPGIQLLKWLRFQPVETALCVHCGFHETGVAQHSQVLGHGRLRHAKLTLDLSHRLLGRGQEAQYRAAVGLRNDLERFHSLCILYLAYTRQGIYKRNVRQRLAQLPVRIEPAGCFEGDEVVAFLWLVSLALSLARFFSSLSPLRRAFGRRPLGDWLLCRPTSGRARPRPCSYRASSTTCKARSGGNPVASPPKSPDARAG
jgi:hypothetical protein